MSSQLEIHVFRNINNNNKTLKKHVVFFWGGHKGSEVLVQDTYMAVLSSWVVFVPLGRREERMDALGLQFGLGAASLGLVVPGPMPSCQARGHFCRRSRGRTAHPLRGAPCSPAVPALPAFGHQGALPRNGVSRAGPFAT